MKNKFLVLCVGLLVSHSAYAMKMKTLASLFAMSAFAADSISPTPFPSSDAGAAGVSWGISALVLALAGVLHAQR